MTSTGQLRASLPLFAPLSSLGKLIDSSREELRKIASTSQDKTYVDGQLIGHSHGLQLIPNRNSILKGSLSHQKIIISHPYDVPASTAEVQSVIRQHVAKALRIESKAYLPRRLKHLAEMGEFEYQKVRFANQSGRWGSCSSSGTISLNIALMGLPFELIDYVLIHELAHTVEMNHSPQFWSLVETYYPDYKTARKALKTHNPFI